MGEKVEDDLMSAKCLPIIVHKFAKDRWLTSHVVQKKGVNDWAVNIAAHDIKLSGLQKFIYKSDGEPAIKAYKEAVIKKLREQAGNVEAQIEESGVGESQGNAMVERAIWEVESMARTLAHAAEELHGVKFNLMHPIRVFAVEYASQLLNRGQKAIKDNRTAYELRKGRPYKRKLPPYSEAVMFLKVALNKRRQKAEDRWATGIYLGLVERSNMVLVGTPEGIKKVNSAKRLPAIQAKDPELAKSIKGYPWNTTAGVGYNPEAGEVPVMVATEPIVPEEELPPRLPTARGPDIVPRRMYIRRDVELAVYGFTDGCPGCDAAKAGLNPVAHTAACRKRIEEAMAADEHTRDAWTRVEANRAARESAGVPAAVRPGGPDVLAPGEAMADEGFDAPEERSAGRPAPATVAASAAEVQRSHFGSAPSGSAEGSASASSPGPVSRVRSAPAEASEPETKRVRREVGAVDLAGMTRELRRFGAVVGPTVNRLAGVEVANLELSAVEACHAEVFCKSRFTSQAEKFGIHPGFAVDATGWDLTAKKPQEEAYALQDTLRPKLLVGSTVCGPWSLSRVSDGTLCAPAEARRSVQHLRACCNLYHKQLDDGQFFLHEHPEGTAPWVDSEIQDVLKQKGVLWVENACRYKRAVDSQVTTGPGTCSRARETTGWVTNSRYIAAEIADFHCRDRAGSTAGGCGDLLVGAVLRGLRQELQERGILSVNALEPGDTGHEPGEVPEEDIAKFYDEASGVLLNSSLVRAARQEEIKFLHSFPVYEKVPEAQAVGKERVSVRWCDLNKGDDQVPNYRSRLVGREFKWQDPFMQGTFAATPPLESLRYLFHWATTVKRRGSRKLKIKMLVLDVSRAHFHAPAVRELYITLPAEDSTPGMVGRLLRTMYGTRDAAAQWDVFANEKIAGEGFDVGVSSPCLYRHRSECCIGWRHGDDIVFLGEADFLEGIFQRLGKGMILKKRAMLGFEADDDHHITILNRLVDFKVADGVETIAYEPDPRHVELLCQQVGIGPRSKGVTTPGEKQGDYFNEEA